MRLPIDTSRLQFLVVAARSSCSSSRRASRGEAWAPRVDSNGEVLWRVQVVALGDGEAEIIRVSVPGDPGVKQGEMVRVDGHDGAGVGDGRPHRAWRSGRRRSARRARGGGEGGGVMAGGAGARRVGPPRDDELVALGRGRGRAALWRLPPRARAW